MNHNHRYYTSSIKTEDIPQVAKGNLSRRQAAKRLMAAKGISRDEAESMLKQIPAIYQKIDGVRLPEWRITDVDSALGDLND